MNISQLQPPAPPPLQRHSKEAEEKDADFLALRLLNKRARVRLSPQALDPAAFPDQARLFAVANTQGCFAAVTRTADSQHGVVFASLSALRSAFVSASADTSDTVFQGRRTLQLPGAPVSVQFASNETRVVVGLVQGAVLIYDLQAILAEGAQNPSPIHTFSGSTAIREILPNPGDIPELVAVLREASNPDQLAIEVLDVQNLRLAGGWTRGQLPNQTPASLSWSPKGKQLAVGLLNGDIAAYAPGDTSSPKSVVPGPPAVAGQPILSLTWLSNSEFYSIHVPPGPLNPDVEQSHFVIATDAKANQASDVKFNTPYFPSPGMRNPSPFMAIFRGWAPSKYLIFIGDSTSSDIGLVGSLADSQDAWHNFSLEETSTPTVPLDKDMNDTILFGLALDLTATDKFHFTQPSGEESDLPPPPVMYAYASDGTVVGWHIINTRGVPYPGMVTLGLATPAQQPAAVLSAPFSTTPTGAFGQPSAFGQAPVRSPPAFGQSAFGAPPPSAPAASTSSVISGGFGAFAEGTGRFGQTGFGFGVNTAAPAPAPTPIAPAASEDAMATEPIPPTPVQPAQISTSASADDAMASDDAGTDSLSLGGLGGLGGTPSDKPKTGFGGGIFGQPSTTPTTSPSQPSAFGGGVLRPATGFGAFANQNPSPFSLGSAAPTTSAFGSAVGATPTQDATKTETKPSSAFGQPAFGQSSFGTPTASTPSTFGQPAFGQPAFGKPAFGQPAFGQSGFGGAKPPQPATSGFSTPSGSSGGFSAFAQTGPTSFGGALSGGAAAPAKPVWAVPQPEKKESTEAPKSVFGQPAPAAATPAATPIIAEPAPSVSETATPSTNVALAEATAAAAPAAPAALVPATSPFSQPTSATTSPFTSQAPAQSGGAFGGLKASPYGFGQVQAGFGAFGNKVDSSSPFFTATNKTPSAAPVSAFTKPATTTTPPSTPPQAETSKPVFGATSSLGAKPSAFVGFAAAKPATPLTSPPASGGFAAFSGATSAFGAAAGTSKSFGELLRQKDGAKDESKAVVKATEPSAKAVIPVSAKPLDQAGTAPAGPVSVFSQIPRPVSVFSKPPETPKTIEGKEALPRTPESPEASEDEEPERDREEDDHDVRSFLSESFSDTGDELDGESAEEEEGSPSGSPKEPANIPLPATPTPEASPSGKGKDKEVAPPDIPKIISTAEAEPVRDGSTTPPGSPEKVAAPEPVPATSTSASGLHAGLGLGRPSTRPTRSSPLARAPITGDEEEDAAKVAQPSTTLVLEPAVKPVVPSPFQIPQPAASPSAAAETKPEAQKLSLKPSVFSALGQVPPPTTAPFKLPAFGQPAPTASSLTTAAASGMTIPTPPPPLSAAGLFGAVKPSPSPPPSLFPAIHSPLTPATSTSAGGAFNWGVSDKGKTSAFPTQGPAMPTLPVASRPAGISTSPDRGVDAQVLSEKLDVAANLAAMAEGMQKECVLLCMAMAREMYEIRTLAEEASRKREALSKPSGGLRSKADLEDARKWAVTDAGQLGHIIKSLETEIQEAEAQLQTYLPLIRALESDLLKATTRREEIAQFSKASQDDEFATMLKTRTLDPDHLETQSQLRREIRSIRERVQQLEDHIQASKKKLKHMKSGKVQVKAPSLNTINRTYRNIDLAIEQEADKVSELTHRVAKLKLDRKGTPPREGRDRERRSQGLYEVTPHVAMSTAAALNAEMTAQKLKNALLAARKEPLLNTQAVDATPTRRIEDFPPPVKTEYGLFGMATPQTSSPAFNVEPGWTLPPFEIPTSPSAPLGPKLGSKLRDKKHHPAPVKKAPPALAAAAATTTTTFEWGPLPNLAPTTPAKGLPVPFDLGRKDSPASPTPASLESSWVTEGFKAK
ncbi:hypothetical protein OBBRIDRAFT_755181 [Obba rivulosa]|uniref:Nucleoporin Nup159/Nup146 N-terminal domain-containing protein n=1 Tax=Obba rivulosa TaxID=1052685 RepID=A0A8E2DJF6_9APHY|nr:hypothetical protein OBBRIDRAFT_755181 [Obba rivulosa]